MNPILTIDMMHLPHSIKLGRCGENHTVVRFDCTAYQETYGTGSAALLFQPARGSMYPIVIEQDDAIVTWRVNSSDTSTSGAGLCELSWYVGDTLVKSQQMTTVVYDALSEHADESCKTASRPWMDQILQASANAQRAQAAAETAQNIADSIDAMYTPEKLKATALDIFYPVGAIYHTTDSSFDPNNAWGRHLGAHQRHLSACGRHRLCRRQFRRRSNAQIDCARASQPYSCHVRQQRQLFFQLGSDRRNAARQVGLCHNKHEKL